MAPPVPAPARAFDKKKYRENKYGVKNKLKKWREDRERSAAEELRRVTGKSAARRNPRSGVVEKRSVVGERLRSEAFRKRSDEKRAAREAAEKAKRERAEAAAEYARKKADKFKKLSKRTKRGQPLMKDRMEMLLEEIQKNV